MNRRQRFHRAALEELLNASRVYNGERAGLGDELVEAVDAILNLAATVPVPGTTVLDNERPSLRRLLLDRFPYEIVSHDRRRRAQGRRRRAPEASAALLADARERVADRAASARSGRRRRSPRPLVAKPKGGPLQPCSRWLEGEACPTLNVVNARVRKVVDEFLELSEEERELAALGDRGRAR
jgi:hypothetical protein